MRNISFSATTEQVLDMSKDVTRRMGWKFLKAGELLQPVRKAQGLKKGEKVQKLGGPIRVVSVRREPLSNVLYDGLVEVMREGFPGTCPLDFIQMFSRMNNCGIRHIITRIEFEYTNKEVEDV